jgi:hypothetical protein
VHAGCVEPIFEAVLANDSSRIAAISARTPGTAGVGELQIEIVRMLLAAGATLADVDRNGVPVADRIQSQALRNALGAGQL